jgi:fluoride exporter
VRTQDEAPPGGPPGPRLRPPVLAAVAAGGLLGGALRWAVGLWLPTPAGGFPWAVLLVNTAGAFVLALVVVLVARVLPGWVRPLVGTGFCGALTTFSSVVVGADRLVARGQAGLAAGYLLAGLAAGLAAACAGLLAGRWLVAARRAAR